MISFKSLGYVAGQPVPVEMIFEGQDPYTIEFVFHIGCGVTQKWTFDKGLLDALEGNSTSGQGDVLFELDERTHTLYMTLSSPEGFAVIEFDPCAIDEFLEEVNFSSEFAHAQLDITDDEIYGWLGGEVA